MGRAEFEGRVSNCHKWVILRREDLDNAVYGLHVVMINYHIGTVCGGDCQINGHRKNLIYRLLPKYNPKQRQTDITKVKPILNWGPKADRGRGLKLPGSTIVANGAFVRRITSP